MEDIIQKAIDGGYKIPRKSTMVYRHSVKKGKVKIGIAVMPSVMDITCDPLFWKCLSKSYDWTNPNNDGSLFVAMKFHEENIVNGFDEAVEYLQELIK